MLLVVFTISMFPGFLVLPLLPLFAWLLQVTSAPYEQETQLVLNQC